ncbi:MULTISPECIES: GAF and ANTAR domain-containing protein [Nocardiaceae]|uniref:Transcriptional regulator with GAF, ATPase, and Fis domain n=2 Tax=Nocardiaceae TaxID=85025 RepID=A0ABS2KMX9_9NOCA|nr:MULTISPECIES: GAF and ANTAR domain-containing protein [Rhodococcus]MBM7413336.1 transcriptional regulator with GAF, ATPase, and Fis domain [Rhodococcus corynebacterioides]MBP1115799.1 transcriptional regulator with GAF, ATPase, and Fis domain [Rhodococcus sp. PvP016]
MAGNEDGYPVLVTIEDANGGYPEENSGVDDALDAVAARAGELNALLDGIADVDASLERLAVGVTDAIDDADAAGVTEIKRRGPRTAAATDPMVTWIDDIQYASGEGPCLEAATTRDIVRVNSEQARSKYPTFFARQAESGMRSFLSAPLTVDGTHVGALNLYSHDDHGFDRLDAAALRIYVIAAESALQATARVGALQGTVDGYVKAMQTRAAIEQCKGIIQFALGVSEEKAFDLLKWRSQDSNVPVRALCEQLLRDSAGVVWTDEAERDRFGRLLMTVHTRVGN